MAPPRTPKRNKYRKYPIDLALVVPARIRQQDKRTEAAARGHYQSHPAARRYATYSAQPVPNNPSLRLLAEK